MKCGKCVSLHKTHIKNVIFLTFFALESMIERTILTSLKAWQTRSDRKLTVSHDIKQSKQGDFLIDETYLFEVGGAKKGFTQIKDMPNSYVAADDLEIGFGNKIPLWLFGMLY